ncbi:hypothetical protein ACL02U_27290 [Streptomyces sp. MS06]|uniref:hypothetical protein n=1 Tax=Streptomyces sp. MS06 TaxID=3385974 RepID=UPI0039A344D5
MAGEHPGVLAAHKAHHVPVTLASGQRADLVVEDVQYLAVPHDRFLHAHNPIARRFIVQQDNGPLELVYNPGALGHAVHGTENVAMELGYTIMFAAQIKAIRGKRRTANVKRVDLGTGEMDHHSYQTVDQIWDRAVAVSRGYNVANYATRAGADFFQLWAEANPDKGYYVVQNGEPVGSPQITHEIRRSQLKPLD